MFELNIIPLKQQYGNSCVLTCARMIQGFYNPNLINMLKAPGADGFYADALLNKLKNREFMTGYFAKKCPNNNNIYNYFFNDLEYNTRKKIDELSVDQYANTRKGDNELEILLQQVFQNDEIIVGNSKSFENVKEGRIYFEKYIKAVEATRHSPKKVYPATLHTTYYGLPHSMVLAGINGDNLICNDPYSGKKISIPIFDIIENDWRINPIGHRDLIK